MPSRKKSKLKGKGSKKRTRVKRQKGSGSTNRRKKKRTRRAQTPYHVRKVLRPMTELELYQSGLGEICYSTITKYFAEITTSSRKNTFLHVNVQEGKNENSNGRRKSRSRKRMRKRRKRNGSSFLLAYKTKNHL